MGPRNSIQLGMCIYCIYVACFVVATAVPSGQVRVRYIVALAAALVGGVGGGFLWTAQRSYFSGRRVDMPRPRACPFYILRLCAEVFLQEYI